MPNAHKHCPPSTNQHLVAPHLSDTDFKRMADFIANQLGIQMPLAKKPMIAARLLRRLRALGYHDYGAYFDYLHSRDGRASEGAMFVDLVTTHTTHFFREKPHFDLIEQCILPLVLKNRPPSSPLRVWCAACSTGEEAYSLAMVLASRQATLGCFDYRILATDVSEHALAAAKKAVYPLSAAEQIPAQLRAQYLLRSLDSEASLMRVSPTLRAKVEFRVLNFMSAEWPVDRQMDIVICRNALIYFSPDQQARIIRKLSEHLVAGGYLILSHTESLAGSQPHLHMVGRSVFQHCPAGSDHTKHRKFVSLSPKSRRAAPQSGREP